MCNLRSGGPSSLFLWPLCLFAFRSPPKKKKKQKQNKPTPDPRLPRWGCLVLALGTIYLFSHLKNLIRLPRLPGTINSKLKNGIVSIRRQYFKYPISTTSYRMSNRNSKTYARWTKAAFAEQFS